MKNKSDKKILFLASWYPNIENPTLGNFVQKHAEIANKVVHVDVLYAVASEKVQEMTISDEKINKLRTVIVYYPSVQSKFPFVTSLLKREVYLLALKKGYNYLNVKYDKVHLNAVFPAGIFARWIKRKHGTPYLATVHWTGFLPQHLVYNKLPYFVRQIYQKIFKDAQKILPVSEHLGHSLQNLGLIKEFEVINNVVNETCFYPAKNDRKSTSPIKFLHISTFNDAHKNISGMFSAFSRLKKSYLLHLITEGDKEEVWEYVDRFNIPREQCIVECKLSAEKIGAAMRAADCFVLFSNYETFSVVLAEAWTTGIPAIYTQCGGLTEIDNPKLGKQIEVGNETMLLKAINEFSHQDFEASKIIEFSVRFSSAHIERQMENMYR